MTSFRFGAILACPSCKHSLTLQDHAYQCANVACGKRFPIVRDVPVLINEENSLFAIRDFVPDEGKPTPDARDGLLERALKRIVPAVACNWNTAANYDRLAALIRRNAPEPLILVVGCGDGGAGLGSLLEDRNFRFVETDVYFSSRAQIIADGHDLPFGDASFDAVVCQAVLEHVVDPYRCVEEIHRVLKRDGLVYAETPFLQPVHMQAHDFTRFTLGGHRRLFRKFEKIDSGVVLGPSMTLALAIRGFFLSLSRSSLYRKACNFVIPFLIFWLKYVDYFLVNRPAASDAAAGVFFLGTRRESPVADREIIKWHWTTSP